MTPFLDSKPVGDYFLWLFNFSSVSWIVVIFPIERLFILHPFQIVSPLPSEFLSILLNMGSPILFLIGLIFCLNSP